MTVSLFITLLMTFSVITSLCTEGCKKVLNGMNITYSSNVLVLIIACIIGVIGTGIYYAACSIEFTTMNVICMFLMGVASSIGAMVGYDKVVQTIGQIKIK